MLLGYSRFPRITQPAKIQAVGRALLDVQDTATRCKDLPRYADLHGRRPDPMSTALEQTGGQQVFTHEST